MNCFEFSIIIFFKLFTSELKFVFFLLIIYYNKQLLETLMLEKIFKGTLWTALFFIKLFKKYVRIYFTFCFL